MSKKKKSALLKGLEYKRAITDYLTEIGKQLIKETVATRWPNVNFMEQVLLIITVLAEFSEQANASIRECAYKIGLISTQYADTLQLTTEPEAAVIYCMRTLKEHIITEVGSLFMIVDCGSGTVDLTTCELLENNRLGEITEHSGDFCGRTYVDKEFIKFLSRKVGDSAINLFNRKDFKTYELDIEEVCLVLKQYVTRTSKVKLEKDDWVIDLEYEDVKNIFDPVFSWWI
ncbi:actin-like ATPase domain-containing protein [Gigaspora margarita]|uniref:Actin-like ATPase domain-containing protein n=1 Tax=Gigaspora margarita TaxID=4874 RepID=A0A8H4A9H0_GIGMA|nr:actin-like ATPase domain-containing protein [Gigaspora margarita]